MNYKELEKLLNSLLREQSRLNRLVFENGGNVNIWFRTKSGSLRVRNEIIALKVIEDFCRNLQIEIDGIRQSLEKTNSNI